MLTDREQLAVLRDRWASRPGPFPAEHGAVVAELGAVSTSVVQLHKAVTLDGLHAYARAFVEVLGSVYSSLKFVDASLNQQVAVCRFAFGQEAIEGEARDVGAALTGALIRFEGRAVIVAKPAKRYQWIRAAAILDADEVFGHLVEAGF